MSDVLLPRTSLRPHPDTDGIATAVDVQVRRGARGLRVEFRFRGAVAVPQGPLDPARLWEHTCAELFLQQADGSYVEWNASPTGQVARFAFSAYRQRTDARFETGVDVSCLRRDDSLCIGFEGPLLRGVTPVRASTPAVVRAADGACGYWALAHPRPEPDFHDHEGFTLDPSAW